MNIPITLDFRDKFYNMMRLNNKDWTNIMMISYLQNIIEELEKNEDNIFPPKELIFNAFCHFNRKDLKVVLIGQDCYHGEGQANGLSFSVNNGIRVPPSLRNILKEMNNDLGINRVNTDFTDLAKQGILFLNCALTVEKGKPCSHLKLWSYYTDRIIKHISEELNNIIFVLWGNYAKQKKKLIDLNKHNILEATHPSPLSANRGGFFNEKHFSKINVILKDLGKEEIIWG
jgi:uracil-DNA glycosylase